jgi:hypothetical protein
MNTMLKSDLWELHQYEKYTKEGYFQDAELEYQYRQTPACVHSFYQYKESPGLIKASKEAKQRRQKAQHENARHVSFKDVMELVKSCEKKLRALDLLGADYFDTREDALELFVAFQQVTGRRNVEILQGIYNEVEGEPHHYRVTGIAKKPKHTICLNLLEGHETYTCPSLVPARLLVKALPIIRRHINPKRNDLRALCCKALTRLMGKDIPWTQSDARETAADLMFLSKNDLDFCTTFSRPAFKQGVLCHSSMGQGLTYSKMDTSST